MKNHAPYLERREELVRRIRERYPESQNGIIILIGAFEQEHYRFSQDSSFYYFTGIDEPGCVLTLTPHNHAIVYIPQYQESRSKWVLQSLEPTQEKAAEALLHSIEYLGTPCGGYRISPLFTAQEYGQLITVLKQYVEQKLPIYTLYTAGAYDYITQKWVLERLSKFIPGFEQCLVDISSIVTHMRRKKSSAEIEELYKAVFITMNAHEAVAHAIEVGKKEQEIHAFIEFVFAESGAVAAFPPIVASGKNSLVLHYTQYSGILNKEELVLIDIGARYNYYCADISRTYPASGTFTKRQRELYDIVLETQEFITSVAAPGYWLFNKNVPDKSLHHLARQFLEERGYKNYFNHGIGHFLGLDVHDVGSYTEPLEEGDVITLEPGIYIPEENIGIRIEDNYWVVPEGVICLSEELFKQPSEIERLVQDKPYYQK